MTVTDTEIARAQALGRAAARAGLTVSSCPYPPDDADSRVLRVRWAIAHAGESTGVPPPAVL